MKLFITAAACSGIQSHIFEVYKMEYCLTLDSFRQCLRVNYYLPCGVLLLQVGEQDHMLTFVD